MRRNVAILMFEESTLSTFASVIEVFTVVDRGHPKDDEKAYRIFVVSAKGGPITMWNGCRIETSSTDILDDVDIDTFVI